MLTTIAIVTVYYITLAMCKLMLSLMNNFDTHAHTRKLPLAIRIYTTI